MSEIEKLIKLGQTGNKENKRLDFKSDFDYGDSSHRLKLIKHIVAMANTQGGIIVFGVEDNGKAVSFSNKNILNIDTADLVDQIHKYTNTEFDSFVIKEIKRGQSKKTALIIPFSEDLIVFSKQGQYNFQNKNKFHFEKGDLYFRHGSKSEKCNAQDLARRIEASRLKERKEWGSIFSKVAEVGPSSIGILDTVGGTIEGHKKSIIIDESLLPKLKFIQEGNFTKKGKPTLRLIGDVKTIVNKKTGGKSEFRLTDNPNALEVSEENILKKFPLEHADLVKELKNRYSDFIVNPKYHSLKRQLACDIAYAKTRLYNPKNPKSGAQVFYSKKIIEKFDNHYKLK